MTNGAILVSGLSACLCCSFFAVESAAKRDDVSSLAVVVVLGVGRAENVVRQEAGSVAPDGRVLDEWKGYMWVSL